MIDKDANREAVKKELSARVELAIADGYKTKQEKQKRKTCSECGKGFLGQDGASTCGPKCRMRKSRKG
jgi:hypothetical protein